MWNSTVKLKTKFVVADEYAEPLHTEFFQTVLELRQVDYTDLFPELEYICGSAGQIGKDEKMRLLQIYRAMEEAAGLDEEDQEDIW